MFFARLVDQVVSVEADRDWFEYLQPKCPPNVTLVYQPFEPDATYCQLVSRDGPQHDIVVIDGSDRMRCAAHASDGLRPGGVVILDDMQRDANLEAANHLHQTGFRRIDFEGPKPVGCRPNRPPSSTKPKIASRSDACSGSGRPAGGLQAWPTPVD